MCLFDDKRRKKLFISTGHSYERTEHKKKKMHTLVVYSYVIIKGYSLNRTFIDGRLISEQSIASNECV